MSIAAQPRPATATPWATRRFSDRLVFLIASLLPAAGAYALHDALDIAWVTTVVAVFLPLQLLVAAVAGLIVNGRRRVGDSVLGVLIYFAVAFVAVVLVSLFAEVIRRGGKIMHFDFIKYSDYYMTPFTPIQYGGAGHAILGTLEIVGLATLVAVPFALGVAVYLTESTSRFRGVSRFFLQAMSGLPSVVTGLFVYAAFIVTGVSQNVGWLGSLALFILMLPTVVRPAEEVIKLVPADLRNAALALGSSRRTVFFKVVLPVARTGIITAILLGVARVIGETAPLLLTTAAVQKTNLNPFSGGMTTLTMYVYSYLGAGSDSSFQRAWGGALLLMILVAILFAAARILGSKKAGN